MQIIEFIRDGTALLAPLYGEREARAIVLRLLQEVAGLNNYIHLTEPQRLIRDEVEAAQRESRCFSGDEAPVESGETPQRRVSGVAVEQRLRAGLQELTTGRPLQYVLGYEWFMGRKFRVAEGVLIPRPETEEMVRHLLREYAMVPDGADLSSPLPGPLTVLDICTGSGCIAWSLAAGLGANARVYGCDISGAALSVAQKQGESWAEDAEQPLAVSPLFFHCNVLGEDAAGVIAAACGGPFDLIVSNPPYVCDSERARMHKNVLDFEPELALFVPDTEPLLFYRKIASLASLLLKPGGGLCFEINERFGMQVADCMTSGGFLECRILPDIHGKDRFVQGKVSF